jgi:hypothetical protein
VRAVFLHVPRLYCTRDEMAQVRSTGFSRKSAARPPKGGTTNGAFWTAYSITIALPGSRLWTAKLDLRIHSVHGLTAAGIRTTTSSQSSPCLRSS